jgi:MFS family permease
MSTGEVQGQAVAEQEAVTGRWPALSIMAASGLFVMTTWFSATAVVPQLRDLWNLTGAQTAWLTLAVQIGFVVGALASATFNLPDVLSPRRLILYGALVAAGANLALLAASGLVSAAILRLLTGAAIALVYPPALKELATWFRRDRGIALGTMVGALTFGSATPHLINGLGGLDVEVVVWGTSIASVAGGLLARFAGREGPYPFPQAKFDPRMVREVFRNRGVRLAFTGYFGHMWELYAMWAWILLFLTDAFATHGLVSAGRLAAFGAFVVIAAGTPGCLLGGVLGDRWGRTRTTMLSLVISGVSAVAIGLTREGPLWLLLAVAVTWGFWVVADSAQFSTVVTEVADQSYVGTAVTVQLALGYTLTAVTIWLVPRLEELLTWRWAFLVLVPGPVVGSVAMRRLAHTPDTARIAQGRG